MNLNIGSAGPSGKYRQPDWVNLEYCHTMQAFKKGKLVFGDGCKMPFKDNCFTEIHCIHMMEHIEKRDHRFLLNEIYRVLKPEGKAFIEVPDFMKTCEQIINLYKNFKLTPDIREVIRCKTLSVYGKGRYSGDAHRHGFYPEELKALLEEARLEVSFPTEMISNHWKQEPVILICGLKK